MYKLDFGQDNIFYYLGGIVIRSNVFMAILYTFLFLLIVRKFIQYRTHRGVNLNAAEKRYVNIYDKMYFRGGLANVSYVSSILCLMLMISYLTSQDNSLFSNIEKFTRTTDLVSVNPELEGKSSFYKIDTDYIYLDVDKVKTLKINSK